MINDAKPYWCFLQRYHALSEPAKKMALHADALLQLRDTKNEVVKRRFAAFISFECSRFHITDKTVNFI